MDVNAEEALQNGEEQSQHGEKESQSESNSSREKKSAKKAATKKQPAKGKQINIKMEALRGANDAVKTAAPRKRPPSFAPPFLCLFAFL